MVTSNPARARVTDAINPYSSKVVIIAVGSQNYPFGIHKSKLEKLTSFFAHHGEPIHTPSPQNPSTPSEAGLEAIFTPLCGDGGTTMKTEDSEPTVKGVNEAGQVGSSKADYTIIDRFHTVGAFKVLTAWLYNEPPTTPTNKTQCKHLLQAYVLARLYNAYQLQNHILDRFRDFHTMFKVDFDNLIWLANRIEDSIACPLTAYFVEQAAFEIADLGFAEFEGANIFLNTFLREGEWEIRVELFKALAKHAQASGGRLDDPAKSLEQDWHVETAGENAGNMKVGARRGAPSRTGCADGVED